MNLDPELREKLEKLFINEDFKEQIHSLLFAFQDRIKNNEKGDKNIVEQIKYFIENYESDKRDKNIDDILGK
jgi:hypothetical protein